MSIVSTYIPLKALKLLLYQHTIQLKKENTFLDARRLIRLS